MTGPYGGGATAEFERPKVKYEEKLVALLMKTGYNKLDTGTYART